VALASVSIIAAQDPPPPPCSQALLAETDATGVPPVVSAGYSPLSLKKKYLYSVNQVLTGPVGLGIAVHAAFDQFRDTPSQWGSNSESFGMRFASHLGYALLKESLAFGVGSVDHEDPRYFRSAHGSGWQRIQYAFGRTFMVRNDSGSMMPAYSRFVADYASPFLVHSWRPGRFPPVDGLRDGTIGIGADAATNIWREFWPDLRQRLPFISRR
jgi:hypothetical protein